MRRLLALTAVLVLAGPIAAPTSATAGVDGQLDAFVAAVDDLADDARDAGAVLSKRQGAGAHTVELAFVLVDLRTTVIRVAAAGAPVADHLATGRLSVTAARDALEPAVRSLADAVQELAGASRTMVPGLWGDRIGAAAEHSPADLLAPAIQAVARALETLEPALEALRPAIEPLAPVIGPACGQLPGLAFLALGLVPVLVPVPLPTLPTPPAVLAGTLLAPVFLLCASLPIASDDSPADQEPGDEPAGEGAPMGPPEAPSAPSAPGPDPFGAGSVPPSSGPSRPSGTSAAVNATPDGRTETAAQRPSAPSGSGGTAQPRLVSDVPLLPIDHDGEATGIAVLVLAAAAVAAAVTVWARRRRGLTDWAIPVAAASGVGAVATGAMAWSGAAEQLAPWAQVPYVISGGMTAFVLGVVSITLAVAGPLARIAAARP